MEPDITRITAWLFDQQVSSEELERKMMEHCVDPNTQSTAGESLLFLACSGGQETLTTALLRLRANPSVANREGVTPLAASIQKGHASIVQALLKAGVSVEDQHISMAAKQGDVFLCQVLLENDNYAGVDKCDEKDGQSPLYTATLAQHYSLVCFLLEKKASPGVVTRDTGNTPLHAAVKQKNIRICKLLIAFGAPVNYPSLRGYTPLHVAAFVGNTDMIQILIQNGANIKAQASNGIIPLDCSSNPLAQDLLREEDESETLLPSTVSAPVTTVVQMHAGAFGHVLQHQGRRRKIRERSSSAIPGAPAILNKK